MYQKEDADSGQDHFSRREYLPSICQGKLEYTRPNNENELYPDRPFKFLRESIQRVYCWVQPFRRPLVIIPSLIEFLDFSVKEVNNGSGRVAGLELSCEWVCEEIVPCVLFISPQGMIED